jgi:hypothetical protein
MTKFALALKSAAIYLIAAALFQNCVQAQQLEDAILCPNKQPWREVLQSTAPAIQRMKFGEYAKFLADKNILWLEAGSDEIAAIPLAPICEKSHELNIEEFIETLARQTGTRAHYSDVKKKWVFEQPAMPLPYSIAIAEGWTLRECGLYTGYVPNIAPVGMDIYMMGRFKGLTPDQLKVIRNEQSVLFASKIKSGVTIDDMTTTTVDGAEALHFKSKIPAAGLQWRQWAFIKSGQAFVIVSAVEDKNESKIIPDVEAMVVSFRLK